VKRCGGRFGPPSPSLEPHRPDCMKRHMHREFAVAEFLPRFMILTFDHE
jgi:hypothetical protein